ncbi:MAG: 4-hydroxy-tetrahydrodipicolinate reductase [Chloroflexi bacterium]|nr:4-hydroxy-tetrahydrodipicolinate reductase [Chloroflexota bacterium]
MDEIRVVVTGALGRMGHEVSRAVQADPELRLVGAVDIKSSQDYMPLSNAPDLIPLSNDLGAMLAKARPSVMVDFTEADAALRNVRVAVEHGVSPVVGTTGFSQANIKEMEELCSKHQLGAVVAPNFAIGAVLMMHFAKIGARYFSSAEIIELHHNQKIDAPSGTALQTAEAMREARQEDFAQAITTRETIPGTRGGSEGGITIHSVRLPGLVAHQEVIFGGTGQTLTIRHDSISRESFMPGVLLAVKEVGQRRGLIYGLENLLRLE